MSDTVHTMCGSLQNGLGDVQTCETILALAYILYYLSITWSQLQIEEEV